MIAITMIVPDTFANRVIDIEITRARNESRRKINNHAQDDLARSVVISNHDIGSSWYSSRYSSSAR